MYFESTPADVKARVATQDPRIMLSTRITFTAEADSWRRVPLADAAQKTVKETLDTVVTHGLYVLMPIVKSVPSDRRVSDRAQRLWPAPRDNAAPSAAAVSTW